MRRQMGFGLIEIMIAMTLGLVLGAGIINVYLESRRNYQFDDEAARLQESARYALTMVKRELSLAGFVGGVLDREDLPTQSVGGDDCGGSGIDWVLDISDALDVVSNHDASASGVTSIRGQDLDCMEQSYVDGSDMVVIKRSAGDLTLKDGNIVNAGADGQWYIKMTDRSDYEWVYVTGTPFPDQTVGNSIDYWEYKTNILFLRDYSNAAGDGVPTLCMRSLRGDSIGPSASDCYVEGVEDLQIEVGIDVDNDGVPERFTASPTAAQLDIATAMRIYILMRSVNTVFGYTNNKVFNLGQKTVAAKNDSYLRQVFSTTIEMRNLKVPI